MCVGGWEVGRGRAEVIPARRPGEMAAEPGTSQKPFPSSTVGMRLAAGWAQTSTGGSGNWSTTIPPSQQFSLNIKESKRETFIFFLIKRGSQAPRESVTAMLQYFKSNYPACFGLKMHLQLKKLMG